jgi:hypothetical protein
MSADISRDTPLVSVGVSEAQMIDFIKESSGNALSFFMAWLFPDCEVQCSKNIPIVLQRIIDPCFPDFTNIINFDFLDKYKLTLQII